MLLVIPDSNIPVCPDKFCNSVSLTSKVYRGMSLWDCGNWVAGQYSCVANDFIEFFTLSASHLKNGCRRRAWYHSVESPETIRASASHAYWLEILQPVQCNTAHHEIRLTDTSFVSCSHWRCSSCSLAKSCPTLAFTTPVKLSILAWHKCSLPS